MLQPGKGDATISACRCSPVQDRPSKWPKPSSCLSCWCACTVPVHADITAAFETVLLDEVDDKASPLGVKGVGELGVCGAGGAVANAVFNATGARVRDFPTTMDKLLAGMPPVS